MDSISNSNPKTIREALADGSLVDVSELARSLGVPCPVFMSPTLIAKDEAQPIFNLREGMKLLAYIYSDEGGSYDIFGGQDCGDRLRVLEPHEEFGGRVVLLIEKDLNIERTTPDSVVNLH